MSEQDSSALKPSRQITDIEINNRRFLEGFISGYRTAKKYFQDHPNPYSCFRIKEMCESIPEGSERNWVTVFLAADEIDKLAQSKKTSYHEHKLPGVDYKKIMIFNHAIRACIKDAAGTNFTFLQTINTIANSLYPARKGPNDKAKQKLIDKLANTIFGMWNEQSAMNLLQAAGIDYYDATMEDDATGVDVFIATINETWIGVDIKSRLPQSVTDEVLIGSSYASVRSPIISTGTNDKDNVVISTDFGIKGIPNNMLLQPLKFNPKTTPDAIYAISQACQSVSYTGIREYDRKGDNFIPSKITKNLGYFAIH